MKNKRSRIVLLSVILIFLVGLLLVHFFSTENIFFSREGRAEFVFKKDKSELDIVTEYLKNSEYKYIYIHDSSGSMYVGYNVKIENEKVIDAIQALFRSSYKSIEKNDNTIHFLRWTWLMDFGSGYAYSINGIDKPRLPYLTKTIPLVEDGWYYYEENYNQETQGNTGDGSMCLNETTE